MTAGVIDCAVSDACSNVPRGQQHPMMNGNQARKDGKIYGAGNWTK